MGWPKLDYARWEETGRGLHLMAQMAGKWRLAHTPWMPHSWHATLYVVPRGLTTGPVHGSSGCLEILFDLSAHRVEVSAAGGGLESFALEPMSAAAFHDRLGRAVAALGGTFDIHPHPSEIEDATPFAEDHRPRPWDREAVEAWHDALLRIVPVFERYRTGFLGRTSPVHLFWGAMDLAVTRFSGRRAPSHPGGIPNLPDEVTREAYSHEVASAGFWPGDGVGEAMFYAYAYPAPDGYADAPIPHGRWVGDLGEFVLPYAEVRAAEDPEGVLSAFLERAYGAAADLGGWDRAALDCATGRPGVVRPV
ncbi:DUF5996 family protein [Jannaschia aquimarina]|uniref:Ava_C0101 and related proteins n=1 Tax=Jannaschia aquimarina TaxID=935700 RepID=A0A0D1EKT8_9RHOB|nr:DUF5996 family protein [Jannaschia aquimarina]KIT16350.1 hypothetical protein jaqu_19460 [Jannaschia aquimarina]SNT25774.1 hypothetical protein SAMN05421775_10939 [Jannaschia aquimarina]